MKTAIVWFRRDLRVSDQPALAAACAQCDAVIPLFVLDPNILKAADTGSPRVHFLLQSLDSLRNNIAHLGGTMLILHGNPTEELARIARQHNVTDLYWNEDYESYSRSRDDLVKQSAESSGLRVHISRDQCIHPPDRILKADGTPYTVFTPYSKKWLALPADKPLPRPTKIPTPSSIPYSQLPTSQSLGHATDEALPIFGGEKAALQTLDDFLKTNLARYASTRNIPDLDSTSHLSPHLRFGTLSARTVLFRVHKAIANAMAPEKEASVFISELIWRDFYKQILSHFPHVQTGCFRQMYDQLEWENDKALFQAWCEGRTGYPIVDAAMRQLNQIGWMHNRLRMITASFLTKDLLIDWRWGERYFMLKLLDGDLAANNGGWQWAAGTGTDAQPYFRIFNPASQAEKFDPEGRFIERYIPEIDTRQYPRPVINHSERRTQALAMFKKVRG